MFTDSVVITVASGKGGAGSTAFHREKFILQGGPSGGDGGRGGSIYFYIDPNADSLSKYRGKHHHKAKNGEPGGNRQMHGKSGEDLTLIVPVGTQVLDAESGELLVDLTEPNTKVLFLEGGKGGLGNMHFKSSTNQKPTYAQPGLPGIEKRVKLELKLIADVGLVGFPNVGKSTLISVVSAAKPEIANYEFTTLKPNLGVVDIDDYNSFVIADIPGIIEGASEGRGLGLEFLKHIERTKVSLYCLDCAREQSLSEQFATLKKELETYSDKLSKNNFAIAITKIDALDTEDVKAKINDFMSELSLKANSEIDGLPYFESEDTNPRFIIPISSSAHQNTEKLKFSLFKILKG
ncbi:MAG: GTPase ObgE [Campylobacterales bacterium]